MFGVTRVLMAWNRPHHLSGAEAESWTLTEVRRLRTIPVVERISLTPVAATHHGRPWDWVCELHLLDGADAGDCLKHPACAEWLGDLHLLGMRPKVAVLEATEAVS